MVTAIARRLFVTSLGFGSAPVFAYVHCFEIGIVSHRVDSWALANRAGWQKVGASLVVALSLLALPLLPIDMNIGVLLRLGLFRLLLSEAEGESGDASHRLVAMFPSRPLVWLGSVNYSIYLVHEPSL